MSILKEALKLALASDLSARELKLKFASVFGIDEKTAAKIIVDAKNEVNKPRVKAARNKILFIPQCLRARGCKAKLDENGYACVRCRPDKCTVAKIAAVSAIPTYVMPGGAMTMKIIKRENPDGVIGVACMPEAEEGADGCRRLGIPAIGVLLAVDGCVDTAVDFAELKKVLHEVGALKENVSKLADKKTRR